MRRGSFNVYVGLVVLWVAAMGYFLLFRTGTGTTTPTTTQAQSQDDRGVAVRDSWQGPENPLHNQKDFAHGGVGGGQRDAMDAEGKDSKQLNYNNNSSNNNKDNSSKRNKVEVGAAQPPAEDGQLVQDSEDLVRVASSIADKHGVVLFTILNDAYLDMTSSWLCNTQPLPDVHPKVLFLTTDVHTGQRLKRRWPQVSVVSMNVTAFSGAQEYSRAGYVRLMVERTRYINRLVQAKVRMLLFEVDFVWLADPLPEVLSHKDSDVTGVAVYGSKSQLICGCFLLLNPTPATAKVWSRLTEQMEGLYKQLEKSGTQAAVSEATNDQTFLSKLLREKYGGVRLVLLSEKLFPEGKWYMEPAFRAAIPHPLVIHNNWVIGNEVKVKRAKQFGHWFVTRDSTPHDVTCNVTAVRDVLAQGQKAP